MTNFEYWKDKIIEINEENENVAIINGKPVKCSSVKKCGSGECELYTNFIKNCRQNFVEWLYSEHKEKPKLTKRERIFCETILYPDDKKITRAFDDLYLGAKGSLDIAINPYMFSFIEKGNPWSVSDLLQLEVEE